MLGILLMPLQSRAAGDDAYQTDLIQRAEALNLAGQRAWWTLLHYRPGTDGTPVISDADDPRFFLAPTGKNDPAAELAATLRAFFNSDPVGGDPQPAQCAFRARYHWLQATLGFDPQRREQAIDAAVAAGRLPLDHPHALPAPAAHARLTLVPPPGSAAAARERLQAMAEQLRAKPERPSVAQLEHERIRALKAETAQRVADRIATEAGGAA